MGCVLHGGNKKMIGGEVCEIDWGVMLWLRVEAWRWRRWEWEWEGVEGGERGECIEKM